MSVFGKVLAFLNILAAFAFVYLAMQARAAHQMWAYSAFRHELALRGLPLDMEEKDEDGTPIVEKLTSPTVNQMFPGGPVRTLKEEFDRRRNEFKTELEQAKDDKVKRQQLEETLLLAAVTGGERDELRQMLGAGKLDAVFEKLAERAVDTGTNREGSRQAIAHLLIAFAEDPTSREKTEQNLRRVVTAVGLRDYTQAMEAHGLNTRRMAERVRLAMADDRGDYLARQGLRVDQVLQLAGHNDDLRRHLQQLTDQRTENHLTLRDARRKDVADLTTELQEIAALRDKALGQQANLEKVLFETQRTLGMANEKNQQLERDIRTLELGR